MYNRSIIQVGDSLSMNSLGNLKSNVNEIYNIGEEINAGAFSTVYKAHHLSNSREPFAVKVIEQSNKSDRTMILEEISIMRRLCGVPNVIRLVDFYEQEKKIYIFQAFAEGGDILDRLLQKEVFTEKESRQIMQKLFVAVRSIHGMNIVHRDLKLENILLKNSSEKCTEVLICDFGSAAILPKNGNGLKTICGTPIYWSPEMILGHQYGLAVDMWSLGCILYALLCGSLPFGNDDEYDPTELYERTTSGDYDYDDEVWDYVSGSAKNLISGMLELDPQQRLTAEKALNTTWMKNHSSRRGKKMSSLSSCSCCSSNNSNKILATSSDCYSKDNTQFKKLQSTRCELNDWDDDEDQTTFTVDLQDDNFFSLNSIDVCG